MAQNRTARLSIETLQFEQIRFGYSENRPIFKHLDVQLPTNANVYVSGPNGSGQSTLLKILAVLVQPNAGRFLINDVDVTQMSFQEFLPFRRQIGYTFDYGGLFANRTLLDNLALPLVYHKICSNEHAVEQIQVLAKSFKFIDQLEQRPASVSGGLRKLVCVLRSFLLEPQLMIMDDPFTGIGTEASWKLTELIVAARNAGSLRHLYLTSREDAWAERMECQTLWIDQEKISIRQPGKLSNSEVA